MTDVLHRSTWMSNMRLTQRSNSPSSSCRPIRFLMLLLRLQLQTLGALTQQHGAFSRRNRQQRPNLWAPHLHMKNLEFTLLCQIMLLNTSDEIVMLYPVMQPNGTVLCRSYATLPDHCCCVKLFLICCICVRSSGGCTNQNFVLLLPSFSIKNI